MSGQLIQIGESIHASIPKTGRVMKELAAMGRDAYKSESEQLDYIKGLIRSQAAEGADYIGVNLDAFGEDDPRKTADIMRQYVKLVRKFGGGVPACIDSSNDDVLVAGLKEWYDTDQPVRQPLINSIKVYTMNRMLGLKKEYDYAFIGLLMSKGKPKGPGGSLSVDELYDLAEQIFTEAQYDFEPEEIFFDSTVFPLSIDMPMEPDVPGYTYRAFETIKRIKNAPRMKNAHCVLGISNAARDLPGRKIGICRAYLAKAIEYGLDAAIVDVKHRFGQVEPDTGLLKLVDAFAKLDGSMEKLTDAIQLMKDFCSKNRKPAE